MSLYRSGRAPTARWWLGGEGSNLDIGLQRTSCCRYTTPDRATLPTPDRRDGRHPHAGRAPFSGRKILLGGTIGTKNDDGRGSSNACGRVLGVLRTPDTLPSRHGVTDQKAPQAH